MHIITYMCVCIYIYIHIYVYIYIWQFLPMRPGTRAPAVASFRGGNLEVSSRLYTEQKRLCLCHVTVYIYDGFSHVTQAGRRA